jgi:hypothetical protein
MPAPRSPQPPPQISRKCEACEEQEKQLQRKEAGTAETSPSEAPSGVAEVLRSPGQPLDDAHELAHTIQQSFDRSPSLRGVAVLQRSPDKSQKPTFSFGSLPLSIPRQDPAKILLFAKGFMIPPTFKVVHFVDESNIIEWAAKFIWDGLCTSIRSA